MLTHVVFFKFNPNTSETDITHAMEALQGLPPLIPEIKEFRFGRDIIHSERSYDLALVSSFEDLAAMQRYQEHPEHQKVVAYIKTLTSSIVAVDFLE